MSLYRSLHVPVHISSALVAPAHWTFDDRASVAAVHASPVPPQRVLIEVLYAAATYVK